MILDEIDPSLLDLAKQADANKQVYDAVKMSRPSSASFHLLFYTVNHLFF